MSGRRFGQVPLALWRKKQFKALSNEAKLAVLYFWCGPHSESAGVSETPDLYAEADLDWPRERWQAARQEAERAGFIKRDAETETVLVVDYLRSNRPTNAGHHRAVKNQISLITCDQLRTEAEMEYSTICGPPHSAGNSDASQELREKVRRGH